MVAFAGLLPCWVGGLRPSAEATAPGRWTSPSCFLPEFRSPSLTLTPVPETAPPLCLPFVNGPFIKFLQLPRLKVPSVSGWDQN